MTSTATAPPPPAAATGTLPAAEAGTAPLPMTPEEFAAMPENKNYELIDGVPVERNMVNESSWIQSRLIVRLGAFCEETGAGSYYESEAGYRIFPNDRIKRPDVSFVSAEKQAPDEPPVSWSTIPPDLVVEVVSPNDNAEDTISKGEEWLAAGAGQLWIISPRVRTLDRYRSDGSTARLRNGDEVTGEGPLEGLKFPLAAILPRARPSETPENIEERLPENR